MGSLGLHKGDTDSYDGESDSFKNAKSGTKVKTQ